MQRSAPRIEQIVLDAPKHRIEIGKMGEMEPREAERRIGFVHRAIGFHAQIVLQHALAGAEARRAVVAMRV